MSLTLAATQTIAGMASSASAVTYTLFGDEITGTTDAYKVLAQGQLGASAATIYTATGVTALVKTIMLANTTGAAVTVSMYINGTAAANQICSLPIPANGEAFWADDGWVVLDGSGAVQYGYAPMTDAIHGSRSGGALHSLATPATTMTAGDGAAGFVTAVDKMHLNNLYTTGRMWVNVVDYGADVTGVADSLAAINAAVAALQPGGIVWFPAGTYNVSGPIVLATYHIQLRGVSMEDCNIRTTSATADIIQINSWYCSVDNLSFDSTVTRTGGFAINIGAAMNYASLSNLEINNQWSCINMRGTLPSIDRVALRTNGSGAANGAGVLISENTDKVITKLEVDNPSSPTGWAAIRVTQTASLRLLNCNLIHSNICLELGGTVSLTVPSVEVVNTFFDTSNYGVVFLGVGSVFRTKFTNCWFGSHVNAGVWFTGTVAASGITFVNCDFYGNARGIYAQSPGGDWAVVASRFAGNTTAAIDAAAATGHVVKVSSCYIGATAAFGANGAGILLGAGAYGNIDINDNIFTDTIKLTDSGATVATPGTKMITGNVGLAVPSAPMVATPGTFGAVETVVHQVAVPANALQVGTTFRVRAHGIITATVPTLLARLRFGTAGTTSDAQICATAAAGVATGAGWSIDAIFTVRTLGSTGATIGNIFMAATAPANSAQTATVAVNTTVANFLSLTLIGGGTTPVVTVVQALIEVVKQ
jgi:hypothetical protein